MGRAAKFLSRKAFFDGRLSFFGKMYKITRGQKKTASAAKTTPKKEKSKMQEIPIFFSVDDNYAPYLAAALNSAIKNSSADRHYKAIVLYNDLSLENRDCLGAMATDNFEVEFVQMERSLEEITDKLSNRLRFDCFTLTIYYRLFIPAMFPQYDKGIYIDSDIILNADLAELFDTDIGDKYIGGCTDLSIQEHPVLVRYLEEAIGVGRREYINSGVLLLNLKKLREVKLDEHFMRLLCKYQFDSVAPDQDYINALCNGNIHYLEKEWNVMPNQNQPLLKNPKLIHYNLYSKPWCYDGVQYGDMFWESVKQTEYYASAKRFKDNYCEKKKATDSEGFDILVRRTEKIVGTDITFKKLHESGEKIRL